MDEKHNELILMKKEIHKLIDECNDFQKLRLIFIYIINIL